MLGYFDYFPDKAETELRTARFVDDNDGNPIPNGTYLFTEYYCTEPKCNCQRLLVKVLRIASEGDRPSEVATISYTWNEQSVGTNATWSFVSRDLRNPFLDPLHRQARYAAALLEFWHDMVQRDAAYANRLKRHYRELRAVHHDHRPNTSTTAALKGPDRTSTPTLTAPTMTRQQRRAQERESARAERVRKSR
ncbi:MAG: hypothetical protein H6822_06940 [Planctomycetaceae bacterium]|nr:hypothetical protein [Planctomycetales bacterium]MCB9921898.1 hypothetical protein [Planctomycetaceae bacterium]